MNLYSHAGHTPTVAPDAFVAPGAHLIGRVEIGPQASVWFNAVLRGDVEPIRIGPRSNVQDGTVMHTDAGFPLWVGAGVTIGHGVILHGCTIEDEALIGMGAVVLNGARIGDSSLIAAGTVVLEGTEVPPGTLVAGVPGKVRRELTEEERQRLRLNAEHYLTLAAEHAASHAAASQAAAGRAPGQPSDGAAGGA